ncbi:MAG: adenylate/guanylate cyclase domain-containing protein [Bradyrhizobium sp.]|jgi:adenylate cyclase|nr:MULTISPECIES: adenylate/guanylate cyclase domain-containing protein [Bradyrhizobium]ABQ37284.1 putative Adenylate cyclase [Bradyrhizobium sp. BTAi1]MCL8486015.1 adenylate/guanylate cyclase domain-containing protein [Bradyrhizobium denitrificans]MDU1493286.1 adenylate/guanylate cyclase domain-containing protein [Bradyrhizobium sp.]MDU1543758.1 adenylate/guanylate cyclase domain-containing protein [Bradyrhizobium sp.]MDU1808227.1 adenylate/guanylate cyclase domain-containing protein [Bradyrhi
MAEAAGPADASAEFNAALMRQTLNTELLRVKALIATALIFLAISAVTDVFEPRIVQWIWPSTVGVLAVYGIIAAFVAFETLVLFRIKSDIRHGRDVPIVWRYVSVLVETSLPTLVLMMQIEGIGPDKALGFGAPLVYFIFIILSTLRLDFWLSSFTGLVAAAELLTVALLDRPSIDVSQNPEIYYHGERSFIIFLGGILAGAVGVQLRRQFAASIAAASARDRVTDLFGQHVSPQVVERLMKEGTAEARDIREVAVMFVDFRGFTAASRSKTPQEIVERLDGAFAVLVDILERHGGIVNKFLGDGFLALFGAPFETRDAAPQAVAAAREMVEAMDRVNVTSSWPLRIGIGIHLGEVVAGSVGSPRRKEYTVIGDTVNFASRLEALNKEFGSHLLISREVRDAAGDGARDAVFHGEVAVRGYDRRFEVWQLQ